MARRHRPGRSCHREVDGSRTGVIGVLVATFPLGIMLGIIRMAAGTNTATRARLSWEETRDVDRSET
jgi:hypothetical protein